jgi:glycosyltransferase involved in cell wall biosynthesis
MNKKVSVIVPIYNAEKFISQTLDSLVNQTMNDIEIICINDGSTDKTLTILEDYKNKYNDKISIYSKLNGGIAETRNYGLSKVTSEYFGFVDSDDTVEHNMLENMYNKALETNSDIVFSDFYWSYPHKETIVNDGPYSTNKEILTSMFATLWNKLYKTSFIREIEINFPEGYRYEDASFLYKLAPYIRVWSYIETPFVHYRQTTGSITHNHNDRVKDMIYVFNDLLDFYIKRDLYEEFKSELEYLFIRFFLGNSFLRTCQIEDKHDRNVTLELSYKILFDNFPKWKGNIYLNQPSLKNKYYKTITPFTYKLYSIIFHFIYLFKKEGLH